MHPYLVLLRAVNLAGHNKVRMDDLRTFYCELGFANVRTLLQSGNVVFHARTQDPARLEERLEREAEKRLGLRTEFIVRTPQEWRAVIAGIRFAARRRRCPARCSCRFSRAHRQPRPCPP